MHGALRNCDFGTAADEMYDSTWREQVGDRATRLIARMRNVAAGNLHPFMYWISSEFRKRLIQEAVLSRVARHLIENKK